MNKRKGTKIIYSRLHCAQAGRLGAGGKGAGAGAGVGAAGGAPILAMGLPLRSRLFTVLRVSVGLNVGGSG